MRWTVLLMMGVLAACGADEASTDAGVDSGPIDAGSDANVSMDMTVDTGTEADAAADLAVVVDEGVDLGPPPDMGVWTCPAGNYMLESIVCGTTDVTETYTAAVTTATVEVEHREDGTCHFRFVEANSGCMKEHWQHLGYPTTTHINANSFGITGCAPSNCTLDAEDTPCMTSDGAGMTMEEVVEIDADTFQISTDEAYGYCGRTEMTQTTRWVRVPGV